MDEFWGALWRFVQEPMTFTVMNLIELSVLWIWFAFRRQKCGCHNCG